MFSLTKYYFNVVARQKNAVLLSVTNKKIDGRDGAYLTLSTGGVGTPLVETMLSTFEKYNGDRKLDELSTFIIGLNIKRIMIYSNDSFLPSHAALLILLKLCKKLDIYCVAYTTKPVKFSGSASFSKFNDAIKKIDLVSNELYILDDDIIKDVDMKAPASEYYLKYSNAVDKCVLEKFMTDKMDDQDDKFIENKTPKVEEITYERHIGKQFEAKGDLVIYNGLIQDYEDGGVDLVAISHDGKTLNLIQCKYWNYRTIAVEHIHKIYQKLSNHNFDFLNLPIEEIKTHLHTQKDEETIREIITHARQNKNHFTIRKTLYIASEKVVDLEIGKHLTMIKPNIFRYEDMKIVVEKIR